MHFRCPRPDHPHDRRFLPVLPLIAPVGFHSGIVMLQRNQPEFVGFHEGAYLQLSVESDLELAGDPSRYKLAALAFDEHISHLLRPVLIHFERAADFDGVVFSSTIKQLKRVENS